MIALAVGFTPPAQAQSMTQTWDVRAEGVTIFHITVEKTRQGWSARWIRPRHLGTDGTGFFELEGPVETRVATQVRAHDHAFDVTFTDPQPDSIPDEFRLVIVDDRHATLAYTASFARTWRPFAMVPGNAQARLGPWDKGRSYELRVSYPTNAEMQALFDADQRDRQTDPIDWDRVSAADKQRRARTQELLAAGTLASGTDFFNAAFVFQHGDDAQDFLKAHTLALVAVARGRSDALWIASATLDRYLLTINQPQIFGTQFMTRSGVTTQEPFQRQVIPDALRTILRVPTLSDQEAQRSAIEASAAKTSAKP